MTSRPALIPQGLIAPRPYILLLSLNATRALEEKNKHILIAIRSRAKVKEAITASQAKKRLFKDDIPQAIVVTTTAILDPKYNRILERLAAYARGGTVIFACQLSAPTQWRAMDQLMQELNLPCRVGSYTSAEIELNSSITSLKTQSLSTRCSVEALFLKNIPRNDAVYLPVQPSNMNVPSEIGGNGEAPVVFMHNCRGYMGYIGTVNPCPEMTEVVMAMCSAPNTVVAYETSGAFSVPRDITEKAKWEYRPPQKPMSSAATSQNNVSKPTVLLIRLEGHYTCLTEDSQVYSGLHKNAILQQAFTVSAVNTYLSASPPPHAVIVTHSQVAEHPLLVQQLIEYTRGGRRVILADQFGASLEFGKFKPFFQKWGLSWDAGSYHRTTFALNPVGVPSPLRPDALFQAYSMKATHLKGVARQHRVYVPTRGSRTESQVFESMPITGALLDESPAAWAPVGKGYLGFVGDVNAEQEATRLIIEMCGVSLKPGDLGPRKFGTAVTMSPSGNNATEETHSERPLPVARSTPITPRAREEDIAERAAKRAHQSRQKRLVAEKLREQGNQFFREQRYPEAAEKYRRAALTYGPQPIYLSNLAAALLKMQCFEQAESAADRALSFDPQMIKARFRRGLARREIGEYVDAILDFRSVLRQDPSSAAAREELEKTIRIVPQIRPIIPEDDEIHPEEDDPLDDIMTESDSSEFEHEGNGIPCRYNNHSGCRHGSQCYFKHAPDDYSVRDELGRNVCALWILGLCQFRDAKCYYAHDKTYLPQYGWWSNQSRVQGLKERAQLLVTYGVLSSFETRELIGGTLGERRNWRLDAWALQSYWKGDIGASTPRGQGPSMGGKRVYTDAIRRNGQLESGYRIADDDEEQDSFDDTVEASDEDEWEERAENFGFTRSEVSELISQGVKPWDDDAWDVLHALSNM